MIKGKKKQRQKGGWFGLHLKGHWSLLLCCLFVLLSPPLDAGGQPRLYVFANADMRARAFEKELEQQLPGVDVTVFSRIRGLKRAMSDRPDAVLALRPVLENLGLNPELQGQNRGKDKETYVLVSTGSAVQPSDLGGQKLGAVNILGRKNMNDFVSAILGVPAPRLTHVTHERDLLSLLQFDAVAAVLTSERWADKFRQKSEMNLRVTTLSNKVGLPAVYFSSAHAKGMLEPKIKKAGGLFNSRLGVTQWR